MPHHIYLLIVLLFSSSVNNGDYIQAVCDRNLAENITRVLYPNDNVCIFSVNFLLLIGSVIFLTYHLGVTHYSNNNNNICIYICAQNKRRQNYKKWKSLNQRCSEKF